MTAVVTDIFRFTNLRIARARINAAIDKYYVAIGRSEAWPNESLPPVPMLTPAENIAARHSLQSMKRITNIAYAAPRYNWRNGDTYVAYDDKDPDLHTKAYFVINQSNFNVYICLKAGPGVSTVEPVGVDDGGSGAESDRGSVAPTAGADGYIWKYLYTISAPQAQTYLTNDFLPVFRDPNVADNTVQGEIWRCAIETQGAGYSSAPSVSIVGDGTGATATAVVMGGVLTDIVMTNVGSGYTYAVATLSGGSPSTPAKIRPVVSPSAYGRAIESVNVVNGGTSYPNGAITLAVIGDGEDASVTGTATGGVIQSNPTVNNGGFNYTEARVQPLVSTAGTDAEFIVNFSDRKGGYGFDPVVDLNAYYIMFSIDLVGDENPAEGFNGDFITANNYRQIAIIKNPLDLEDPASEYVDATAMLLYSHKVNSGGTWALNDVITGGSSGAKGIVDFYDPNEEVLYYHQTESTGFAQFSNGETLTGQSTSTGAIAAAGGSANRLGSADKYSGNMLYLENRVPISRAPEQIENLRLVVQF